MATITLYKDKLNGVGGLIDNIIKSSNSLDTQLGTLKSTLQGVSNSTYNLQDTVNNISSSSKTEKEKVSDLKKLRGIILHAMKSINQKKIFIQSTTI